MQSNTVALTDEQLLEAALGQARDTRRLVIGHGSRRQAADQFRELFGGSPAIVIADENTFGVAGRDVYDALRTAGQACCEPMILSAERLYAEYSFVRQIERGLRAIDAIPVAVGAGVINDLVKLAAHRCGRRYLSVATAASMDGYTAFGASITFEGSKQTFDCPAPLGVVADLEVIAAAPAGMNASGYADLVAKCPAGADWILADGLGEEPIVPAAWELVQSRLHAWMADPTGVRQGKPEALRDLTTALMMTGFAMQASCSSRPASGAEHQFSHLWDMEHHNYNGETPSHGFKVGIGTLASLALYDELMKADIEALDVEAAVAAWPDSAENEREINSLFDSEEMVGIALKHSGAKHIEPQKLRAQLESLRRTWPRIQGRLADQMLDGQTIREMLGTAGCPTNSEQIGISSDRLRSSYRKAYHIRPRYTVLDFVRRANLWDESLMRIFPDCRQENRA